MLLGFYTVKTSCTSAFIQRELYSPSTGINKNYDDYVHGYDAAPRLTSTEVDYANSYYVASSVKY